MSEDQKFEEEMNQKPTFMFYCILLYCILLQFFAKNGL